MTAPSPATPPATPAAARKPRAFKSKTLAALLAFALGSLGAHRFYLHGLRDRYGWAHIAGTLLGVAGWEMLVASTLLSTTGWMLAIIGAVSVFSAFLAAIVYGLRSDERWDAQFNADSERQSRSGWSAVIIVSAALFIGTFLMMMGFAVAFQTYFETHMQQNSLS